MEEMAFELSIEEHLGENAHGRVFLLSEGEASIFLALPSPRVQQTPKHSAMSHRTLLELVLKQRACVGLGSFLVLMRGGALSLSGLLDLTLGRGCGLISLL